MSDENDPLAGKRDFTNGVTNALKAIQRPKPKPSTLVDDTIRDGKKLLDYVTKNWEPKSPESNKPLKDTAYEPMAYELNGADVSNAQLNKDGVDIAAKLKPLATDLYNSSMLPVWSAWIDEKLSKEPATQVAIHDTPTSANVPTRPTTPAGKNHSR